MEDKRGTKCSHSPSAEGSPPSDAKIPPSTPSGSPPPPGSPSKISSRHPCSPMFEQGGASRKAPVIDLSSSSDEEDLIATSRDFEFAQRFYGDLNRVVLGSPGDDKIIVLSDSNEEEVCEEKTTDTTPKMQLLLLQSTLPQPPPSTPMMALRGQKMIIVMIRTPIKRLTAIAVAEVTPVSLRLSRQEGAKAGVL
jgi:hypothetical protein